MEDGVSQDGKARRAALLEWLREHGPTDRPVAIAEARGSDGRRLYPSYDWKRAASWASRDMTLLGQERLASVHRGRWSPWP